MNVPNPGNPVNVSINPEIKQTHALTFIESPFYFVNKDRKAQYLKHLP